MSSKGLSGRIKLSSYDDMFSAENDGDTAVEAKPADGQIVEIPLSELHTFENHPFRVVDDENMEEMEIIKHQEMIFMKPIYMAMKY